MKKIIGMMWLGMAVLGIMPLTQRTIVFAATVAKSPTVMATPQVTPPPTPSEYLLPFPGILPTHPLYIFKNLRDRIIELLITDPIHKAEFYILQADKKLNMGITLGSLGKATESASSYKDALAARLQAVVMLEQYVKAGNTVPGYLMEKLLLSLAKHKEVLPGDQELTQEVEAMIVRVQQLSGSVSK